MAVFFEEPGMSLWPKMLVFGKTSCGILPNSEIIPLQTQCHNMFLYNDTSRFHVLFIEKL